MSSLVNPQVTDAVTQSQVSVLADAPTIAMGNLYQATSQALANAAHNATSGQQNANTIQQATTTQCVAMLLAVDTAASAVGIAKILQSA